MIYPISERSASHAKQFEELQPYIRNMTLMGAQRGTVNVLNIDLANTSLLLVNNSSSSVNTTCVKVYASSSNST